MQARTWALRVAVTRCCTIPVVANAFRFARRRIAPAIAQHAQGGCLGAGALPSTLVGGSDRAAICADLLGTLQQAGSPAVVPRLAHRARLRARHGRGLAQAGLGAAMLTGVAVCVRVAPWHARPANLASVNAPQFRSTLALGRNEAGVTTVGDAGLETDLNTENIMADRPLRECPACAGIGLASLGANALCGTDGVVRCIPTSQRCSAIGVRSATTAESPKRRATSSGSSSRAARPTGAAAATAPSTKTGLAPDASAARTVCGGSARAVAGQPAGCRRAARICAPDVARIRRVRGHSSATCRCHRDHDTQRPRRDHGDSLLRRPAQGTLIG